MSAGTGLLHGDGASPLARLVVSPSLGRFRAGRTAPGAAVDAGDVLGVVTGPSGEIPVTSPFAGVLGGVLALDGEPLRDGQAVAWLHDHQAVACDERR